MIIINNTVKQVKALHDYNRKRKMSDWTRGLNKAGRMPGSQLDKLRNSITMDEWIEMFDHWDTIEQRVKHTGPFNGDSIGEQWDSRVDQINDWLNLHYTEDFQAYLANKGKNYRQLQTLLWGILVAYCEALEWVDYGHIEDNSKFKHTLFEYN